MCVCVCVCVFMLLHSLLQDGLFSIPADMPAQAADLVNRMLVVDPLNRASMQEIK